MPWGLAVVLALWGGYLAEAFAAGAGAAHSLRRSTTLVAHLPQRQEHVHHEHPLHHLPPPTIRLLARADGEALSSVRKWHIHHLAQLMAPGSESYCLVAWSGSDIIGWLDVSQCHTVPDSGSTAGVEDHT
eukprot:TRINITY_DN4174_c0_g1_i4.p1 TRINITY_DN4174_c0_g1~~TRINITY_DN4174_c0_g1_i4.p1  ORF type:complete len:130 (-),score=16.92 TRINITY_DN4174_c0_g1_i4:23-412(-)